MKHRFHTVICMLNWNGLLLLLKRSDKVHINPRLWCGVAGRIEEGMSPEDTAYKEIMEETGLQKEDLELRRSAEPILVDIDDQNEALTYPFLFRSSTSNIRLDWEHTNYIWVKPEMISNFKTVPKFNEVLTALMPEFRC